MNYQERIVGIEERNRQIKARIEALEERKRTLRQAQEQIMNRTPRDTWHLWAKVSVPAGADAARNAAP
jgi:hypothetical protein